MTTQESNAATDTGRTPSLFASLLVFAVMIGLILTSVVFFGDEVAAGPLQVSMTLSTLFALAVAYFYGHKHVVISKATTHGVNATLGTIFVLLAIGAIIGSLYLSGTVAAFVHYGVQFLSPRFYYITVFLLAGALGMLTGSSFTTIGAVGVAFVGLASVMGVSPAITAGAAVSGAFLGDKTAKISDTFVLTTSLVGGVTPKAHARMVLRTAVPTVIISAVLFLVLGLTFKGPAAPVDVATVQDAIGRVFNVSLLAFIPVVLIFVLSALRMSGFLSLMLSALAAVILAAFTQHDLIVDLAADPGLHYLGAVLKVGIDVFANGFHVASGDASMDKLFSGGGTWGMFETVWLILVAASFGAVVDSTGMIRRVVAPVLRLARGTGTLVLATVVTSIGLNALAADPYVSIMLTERMYRDRYIDLRLKPAVLSAAIADSGTIASPLIPWNVHGAFVVGALGVSAVSYAPWAFLCYLSPVVAVILGFTLFRRQRLPEGVDARASYGQEPAEVPEPKMSA